ncbi:hypothetical protein [Candidatus Neptunochlamydia vexilliferae]|uniref:hypothetical protein n=1 Tax=Candidatus Neptunichlamydia vexilliferae TaxID=1651774 RepID=UPI001891763D|nr:hypothetical protein [Candidatus Neptunochlamydia vexilliferae]
MAANFETKRITLDIPEDLHRKLKAVAALMGMTLKEYILGCVEDKTFNREPTETLWQAMEDSRRGENLNEYVDVNDLFKKLNLDEED